jgi:hypothetical protein
MSILIEASNILETAGYSILQSSQESFAFEDSSLLGFVWESPSAAVLLGEWRARQDAFLSQRDRSLRRANQKSWNVYCVALTQGEPSPEELSQLAHVEDDFAGTRKIARGGMRTPAQISQALLPLLPIQNRLGFARVDAYTRLRSRLDALDKDLASALLDSPNSEVAIAGILNGDENP